MVEGKDKVDESAYDIDLFNLYKIMSFKCGTMHGPKPLPINYSSSDIFPPPVSLIFNHSGLFSLIKGQKEAIIFPIYLPFEDCKIQLN